jgi:hypothetical protein
LTIVGADMPVVLSLPNAYAGLTAVATGFAKRRGQSRSSDESGVPDLWGVRVKEA